MSIIVICPQGHAVAIDEPIALDVACPRCGAIFATRISGSDEPAVLGGMAARPHGRKSRDEDDQDMDEDQPRKRRPRDDDDDEDDRPRGRKSRSNDDDTDDDDRPRKRKPSREEEEPEDEEDDDEPFAEIQLTRKQRQFSRVRLGVLFHIFKLWTYLAAIMFGMITLPLWLFVAAFGGGWIATVLFQITFNLSMTLAPVFGLIGSVLCAFAPARSETRGTIIVSVVFDVMAPFFGILQLIMFILYLGTVDDRVERLVSYMYYGRITCTIVAWWLFQLYLRKLSFYIRESLLASESLNVIVHLLIATVISPALIVGSIVVFLFFSACFGLIMFLVTMGWMIFFLATFPVRQFRLLFLVRTKIYDKFLKPPD